MLVVGPQRNEQRPPDRSVLRLRRAAGAGAALVAAAYLLAWRLHPPRLVTRLRRLNRRTLNPVMLRVAGRPWAPVVAVHHVGRRSGDAHTTPVLAQAVGDGHLIPLLYGDDTDWVRNVLAAGGARLSARGTVVAATSAEVLPAAAARAWLHPAVAWAGRILDVRSFLLVRSGPGSTRNGSEA